MKLSFGSIQRKGRALYYVSRIHAQQNWTPLKTGNLRLARVRARLLVPADDGGQTAWLRQLVRLGEQARRRLLRIECRSTPGWSGLWEDFLAGVRVPVPAASHASYRHWLDLLAQAARTRAPDDLTAADARTLADTLRKKYLSAGRMIRFYRRVWDVLGLDAEVWRAEARLRGASGEAPHGRLPRRRHRQQGSRAREFPLPARDVHLPHGRGGHSTPRHGRHHRPRGRRHARALHPTVGRDASKGRPPGHPAHGG